jgi:hypothetical protein
LATVVGLALLGALAVPAGAVAVEVNIDSETADLTADDPTQTGQLTFGGGPSTCGTPKPTPAQNGSGLGAYDSYSTYTDLPSASYTNLTNQTICLTVNLVAGTGSPSCVGQVFAATYEGSFTPLTPTANYLADAGSSPGMGAAGVSYGFDVGPGGTFVNVVSAVDPNPTSLCDGYIYLLKAPRPFAKTRPTITGTPVVGSGLGFTSGTWAGDVQGGDPSLTNQWLRCDPSGTSCGEIAGAGGYLVTASDVGSTLRLRVIAEDGGGATSEADSAPTAVVPPAPATNTPTGKGGGAAKKRCKKAKKTSASVAKKKKCKKKKR